MGIIQHNAIIATTWDRKAWQRVCLWISGQEHKKLFVTNDECLVNTAFTVILCPDGSKEGWADSDIGDALRQKFIEALEEDRDAEDGSSPWDYAEVGFGELGLQIKN